MQAVILSIGDELVLGQTLDTNSQYLSALFASDGISTLYHQTVADDLPTLTKAFDDAARAADLVIASGGLGPTADDLTRQALADAMGVPLVAHGPSLEAIRARMERQGRKMAEQNKSQAMHPEGTVMLENTCGTAPGIKAKLHNATIYVVPGPPREMKTMIELSVLPELGRRTGKRRVILTTKINSFGRGESTVAEQLGELMDRKRNPTVGTTVSQSIVSVRVRSDYMDADEAKAAHADSIAQVESRLGAIIYGREDDTIQQSLVELLRSRKLSIATAESCTGGLIGSMITDVAGSSSVYLGGWVTYSNAMKQSQLGVTDDLLESHGAVSEPVCEAMAQGARERTDSDIAIAVTGIAGPDGGTADKPVGTVFVGAAFRDEPTVVRRFSFVGDRDTIRDRAAKCAMQMVRLHLMNQTVDDMIWAVTPTTPAS